MDGFSSSAASGSTHRHLFWSTFPLATNRENPRTMIEHVPLSSHSTFRIGGNARYFARVRTVPELAQAIGFARANGLSFFILGGGSNILFSDKGFDGLVIKMEIPGRTLESSGFGTARYIVGAGEPWDAAVAFASEKHLWGLENLSYIPGTTGGVPVQNVGAYGVEASDVIEWVEALDVHDMSLRVLPAENCGFGYRASIFKKPESPRFIVTKVAFLLKERGEPVLSYKDVTDYFKGLLGPRTPREVRDAVIAVRKRKLPEVSDIGTAGSFFENPVLSGEAFSALTMRIPGIAPYAKETDGGFKLSAAYLLDAIGGWKGYRNGDAGVYDKHALVLVNHGAARGADMESLAHEMTRDIKNKTGIALRPEVEIFSQRKFFWK